MSDYRDVAEYPGEQFWHRRYDEQHRTLHDMEDHIERAERALWESFLASGADPSPYCYETRTPEGREAGFQDWRQCEDRYATAVDAVRQLREDHDA